MKRQSFVVVGLAMLVWLNALAQQSVLARTGVSAKELQDWVTRWISESTAADSVWLVDATPPPTPAGLPALRALTPADKLALTQEVLASVKATVMAPGFRAAHTDRIAKQTNRAVDHGIDATTYGISGNLETDAITTTVVPIIQMMRSFPDEAVRQGFEDERAELPQQINDEEGEERAKLQAYLAKAERARPAREEQPARVQAAVHAREVGVDGRARHRGEAPGSDVGRRGHGEDPARADELEQIQPRRDSEEEPHAVH